MTDGPRMVTESISREELAAIAHDRESELVKAVVDLGRGIMAVGGDLHADEEQLLLDEGSQQVDLWGINLYPDRQGGDFVEFDSMINIRPRQGNRTRGVDSEDTRAAIVRVVSQLVRA